MDQEIDVALNQQLIFFSSSNFIPKQIKMDDGVVESVLDAKRRLASSRQILSINTQEENIAAANEVMQKNRFSYFLEFS